jgi:hypothetical protein
MTVSDLLKIHDVDLPKPVKDVIKDSLKESHTTPDFSVIIGRQRSQSDYAIEKKSGKLYLMTGGALTELKPPKSTTDEED